MPEQVQELHVHRAGGVTPVTYGARPPGLDQGLGGNGPAERAQRQGIEMLNIDAGRTWLPSVIVESPSIVADRREPICRDNAGRSSRQQGSRPFLCTVPKDVEEFGRVHEFEQRLFGNLAFPRDVADEIYTMRPEIFSAVFDQDGSVVAYTCAFFLRPEWGTALIRGDISDLELRPHMMYRRNDCHAGVVVYLGAVAVAPTCDPILKAMLLASLMWFRLHQMRSASVERLSAIMTAVSKEGERLARRMGAKKLNDRTNRKDGVDIFGCDLSLDLLGGPFRALENFPFAKSIEMNLDFPPFAAVN
jgi:hypothetical protein